MCLHIGELYVRGEQNARIPQLRTSLSPEPLLQRMIITSYRGPISAHISRTSAASKIFLNCVVGLTFTVHSAVARESSTQLVDVHNTPPISGPYVELRIVQ